MLLYVHLRYCRTGNKHNSGLTGFVFLSGGKKKKK